jgi:hypothetical protein
MEPTRDSPVLAEAQHDVTRNQQGGGCKNRGRRSAAQVGRFAGENQASDRWLALIRKQNNTYSSPAPREGS